ncbi:MlaD family protein [Mycolicibacterium septicum]|uniref:MlaD family protein n=1 Tax=Mycolicibacterium septicum TaxID=98668 RepID=UPI00235F862C|nr:MlaD family protein [Mycolicibacterium septicum]
MLIAAPNWRRLGRVAGITLTAATVAAAVGSCAPERGQHRADYCAFMPDSVGLYVGNPVTQMGYPVGTVKSITLGTMQVRVDFTVGDNGPLPRDVKAIIRSTSVLADRSLELVEDTEAGPKLRDGECIPLSQSFTPKSLSEVIGSATDFINAINPDGSTNVGDVVREVDQAIHTTGPGVNQLLATTSAVLNSPDKTVNAIGSVITNLTQLTSLVRELRGPLKQTLIDLEATMPDVLKAAKGAVSALAGLTILLRAVAELETNLGQETQFTLDATSMAVRKAAAHAPAIADLLTPLPWWINTIANHYNNRPWNLLQYRPPLYRVRTPDGVALCNIMNASAPGSCANVQGQPYAVDVALLQYVLTQASR